MKERWQMHRMGLVNFWYFDDQEFEFANGKLLIRGQNGSGKSISTQSFIPFILDGNKAPYRLDPFGSKDRRMEYYFLLDGKNDESVGYIWLEFKKMGSDQYRTLVIGQRARKNSDMQFWSGIILDNRRINRDFQLKKRLGDSWVILAKQEFKNALGESNFYSERAVEYKAAVNKHIFGFDQLEQYDQFVDLLIKVRAPKLSKEFKPTKIYEIYNESLQVLSDSDILPMVESMEEIDRTQAKLDEFQATKKALDNVGRVYNVYNRYYLAKKAQNYIRHRDEFKDLSNRLIAGEGQYDANQKAMEEIDKRTGELGEANSLLQTERASLPLDDIEAKIESYKLAKSEVQDQVNELKALQVKLDGALVEKDVKITQRRQLEQDASDCEYLASKGIKELDSINEIAKLPGHQKIRRLENPNELLGQCDELEGELNKVAKKVDQVLGCLDSRHQEQLKRDELAQELSHVNEQIAQSNSLLDGKTREIENAKDELINRFYHYVQENHALDISSRTGDLANIIREYKGYGDFKMIDRILVELKGDQAMTLSKSVLEMRFALNNFQKDRDLLNQELISLIQAQDLEYPANDSVGLGRKILKDNGIDFISVYQALEFDESLGVESKNILEAQLVATNLIDAIIVNHENYQQAKELLRGHDQILVAPTSQGHKGRRFVRGNHPRFESEIDDFIAMFDADEKFGLNGHYRYGLVEGFVSSRHESVYVGEQSRKANRKRQIASIETKIALLEKQIATASQEIDQLEQAGIRLEEDYESLQVFDGLDELLGQLGELEAWLIQAARRQQELSNQVEQVKARLVKIKNDMLGLSRDLPYHLESGIYQDVKESLGDYRTALNQVNRELLLWQTKSVQVQTIGEVVDKISEQVDQFYALTRQEESRIAKNRTIIATIENYLNQESTKELHKRVRRIDETLEVNGLELEELTSQRHLYREANLLLERDIALMAGQKEKAEVCLDLSRELFVQELDLEYVPGIMGNLDEQAKKAGGLLLPNEAQKSDSELLQSLNDVQRNNFSALTNYGINTVKMFKANEYNLVSQRYAIVLKYQNNTVDFFEFYEKIAQTIENTQLLIVEKDKELFEKFFSDALANKLIRKINDAKSWVKDMSELMEDLKTTSAISFSLAWKPKAALSSDDLATMELVRLLESDREILSYENLNALSQHFSKRIKLAKQEYLENDIQEFNYGDLVRQALDYREWFEFCLYYRRAGSVKKELTNSAFNVLSGGEKAMAMYVPLFTAVNAQYKKSSKLDFPRIIALDEAFAGVDSENISSMFDLVEKLDFDFIMNSQVLWGTDGAVKELAIAELYRPLNSQVVSTINYHWNGKVKTLL